MRENVRRDDEGFVERKAQKQFAERGSTLEPARQALWSSREMRGLEVSGQELWAIFCGIVLLSLLITGSLVGGIYLFSGHL